MNEVSIIINGVRYDAVEFDKKLPQCELCECFSVCFELAACPLPSNYFFKKSDKVLAMKKNELRFSRTLIGDIHVSLWRIRRDFHCDRLIDGAYGDTKMEAVWSLIKRLYRYGSLTELFYIKSIKYERK